jgi:hypothetical protein
MSCHESAKTTKLYGRRAAEVERFAIWNVIV